MDGLHLLADLEGCSPDAPWTDPLALATLCEQAARAAGLTVVSRHWHSFGPGQGVTGVVLLAESHIAAHTWPERAAVTLDIYVCHVSRNNTDRAEAVLETLLQAFRPTHPDIRRVQRGRPA